MNEVIKLFIAFLFDSRYFIFSLTTSLVLHLALANSLLSKNHSKPTRREELVVELIGVVSNHQTEQKQRGDTIPSSTQNPMAPPPHKVLKKPINKATASTHNPMSQIKLKSKPEKIKPDLKPKPEQEKEQQADQTILPASKKTIPLGAELQQIQQTVKPRESEGSLIRKYLAGLKRNIQNHLVYPHEAIDTGYVGAPMIRFTITESGNILPGSLSVTKSSGSVQLDQEALRAARSSVPLPKPPHQMTVAIKVAFGKND